MPPVIGTAGHIDHGKTALVRALTGQDTDRLKEEKERGISIDLGFAHLDLPGRERVGVVDVPGHERFIRNMLAGAHGIDVALLVVAADDGVMPQTEEHLDILHLLGVTRGLVAVTKTDLVDDARVRAAVDEVRVALDGTSLAGALIVPVSAATGAGVEALRAAISARSASIPSPVRLETATTGALSSVVPRVRIAISSRTSPTRAASTRSTLVMTKIPRCTSRRCRMSRCSSVCGMTPSSAATVKSTRSMPCAPASMLRMNRSCPGTSTTPARPPPGASK